MRGELRGIAIGIPAHNEADRVARTIASVLRAARGSLPIVVVVAADACDDRTAEIARQQLRHLPRNVEGHVISVAARRAGVARDAACRTADARLRVLVGDRAPRWIATTDADTVVPGDWLATHRRWIQRGADAITGLVQVDPTAALAPSVKRHLDRELRRADLDHGHIFGANLGVTAAWFDRVGGFSAVAADEDVMLIGHLRDAGARVIGVADSVVVTSARLDARAPRGFGATLAALSPSSN